MFNIPPRSSPVIMGGVLFFNRYNANGGTRVEHEVVAVDLHTGEELWISNWDNRELAFGQLFYWDSYNYHGTFAYLWSTVGSTWNCYEASTGRWVYSMSNVPSGTRLYGPKGEIIVYTIDLTNGWMTKWNSTHVVTETHIETYGPTGSQHGSWIRMNEGTTLNATLGIMWNVTIPTGLPGSVWTAYLDDKAIGNEIYGTGFHYMIGEDPIVYWAINLKEGQEGNLLYNVTWQKPQGDVAMWRVAYSAEDGVFVMQSKEPRQLYGFDMNTGRKLWGPTDAMDYRSIYSYNGYIVNGKLYYVSQFAGTVYCYDVKTGDLLWTYYADDPYGASEEWQKEFGANEWPIEICFITDGKVYITHSEHSPNMPLPRGAPLICLDAETGEVIFRANGLLRQTRWGGRHLIGDSIMVGMDTYDQRVYGIGKGPSATTVSAGPKTSVLGDKLVVEGMVTDISPGTDDSTLQKRFPNGVPAVCDDNMSDWMLYVYKQFAKPADVMGVDVTISVLDPNGNYYDVATATSDDSGFYHVVFTPPVPGEYKIVAAFTGSNSYYGSYAETAVNVAEAPTAIAEPTPTPASMTDTYVLGIGAGSIIAIVAIGLLVILMLRKR